MPRCKAHSAMSDGSSKVPWIIPIVVALIGLIASPVWGPPLCRAVRVCEAETPGANGPAPTVGPFIPSAETNIFLSETSDPTGSKLKVSGEGFQPGETIVISMHTTQIGTTTASPAGSFSGVEVTVPEEFGVFATHQFFVIANGKSSIK